jgi:hypothetical protein
VNGPDELGPPASVTHPPPQADGQPAQRRRAARRRRRITLASVGAVVGIAVGVATIWHLFTEPHPPPPPPRIVKDLSTMRSQAITLGTIRARIERDVIGAQAKKITLANAARDITEHNRQRREVLRALRELKIKRQKNIRQLANRLSDIVVLEQKTAAAYVACFRAGRTTCPPAQNLRDQQGEQKTIFASNFNAFVAKHQYPVETLISSQF